MTMIDHDVTISELSVLSDQVLESTIIDFVDIMQLLGKSWPWDSSDIMSCKSVPRPLLKGARGSVTVSWLGARSEKKKDFPNPGLSNALRAGGDTIRS